MNLLKWSLFCIIGLFSMLTGQCIYDFFQWPSTPENVYLVGWFLGWVGYAAGLSVAFGVKDENTSN